jgi:hypothetical protein
MNPRQQLFQALSSVVDKPHWSEDEMKALDRKDLRALVTYNVGGSQIVSETLKKHLDAKKGFNEADRAMAARLVYGTRTKQDAHWQPEEFVRLNGGRIVYGPEKVIKVAVSGEKQERPNSVIPIPFGDAEKRTNVQALAIATGPLVKNTDGAWVEAVDLQSYNKIFTSAIIKVPGLRMVAKSLVAILNNDSYWRTLTNINKSAVTGAKALMFIRDALDRCDSENYIYFNTIVVYNMFNIFEDTGEGWIRMKVDKKVVVPDSCFEKVDSSTISKELRRKLRSLKYPYAALFVHAPIPQVFLPEYQGTLESLIVCTNMMKLIQAGDSSIGSILANMRDFSGLCTDMGKRIQFTLASMLYCWSEGRKVDVHLHSTGDLDILVSSSNNLRNHLRRLTDHPVFRFSDEEKVNPAFCDVKFVAPSVKQEITIGAEWKKFLTPTYRHGSVVIYYTDHGIVGPESKTKKKPEVDVATPQQAGSETQTSYDFRSQSFLPDFARTQDVIAWTAIWGKTPFIRKTVESGMNKIHPWPRDLYVFKFSNASNFRGIVTTLPDFKLIGYGHGKKPGGGGWDLRAEDYVPVPLVLIRSEREWYDAVHRDIAANLIVTYHPVSRYSPISNLVTMSQRAAQLVQTTVTTEEGVIIPNARAIAKGATTVEIIEDELGSSDDEEGDEVHEDELEDDELDDDDQFEGLEEDVPIKEVEKPEKKKPNPPKEVIQPGLAQLSVDDL